MSIFGRFASYFSRDGFYQRIREFARVLAYSNTPPVVSLRENPAGTHRPVNSDGHMRKAVPRRVASITGSRRDQRANKRKKDLARLRA